MKRGRATAKLAKTFIATQQGYDVYTVNAFGVRDIAAADEEFTNFATHGDFPKLIAEHEIWIDERLFENEGLYYIANALTKFKEQEAGGSEERANTAALNVERALRERLVGVKYRAGRPHKRVPKRIYVEPYVSLPDVKFPIEVWSVDGNLVRSFYKTDYTEGGHGYVYPWVPKGQIWVEHGLDSSEVPYILCHEYLELRLMRDKGLEYDPAHEICVQVEFAFREADPIKSYLAPDGRKVTKRDLPKLVSEELFAEVWKTHSKR